MTQEAAHLLMIKGMISELPPDDRAKVDEAIAEIRATMSKAGEPFSTLAIAVIGAELAATP